MTSTFVNDLRLNEQGTGDNPGSWGTVTNTNLELIAEAFSYGTETIGDADTTITMQDGTSDAARSLYLKIASSADLTTTRVITLAPNTVSKVWIIENATSGGQIITIKQGTGATVNIPNGSVKVIATDGAGSGGIVYDLFTDLDVAGTFTIAGALSGTTASFTTADNNPQLTLTSTDTDSGHGPRMNLVRNPGEAGADGDNLGQIFIQGYNDAGTPELIDYFQLFTEIEDSADGAEDARQIHYVMTNGSQRSRIEHISTETSINNDNQDVDFRVATDNHPNAFFVNGQYDGVAINSNAPISYANAQAVLFIEDSSNPAIGISDTGQTYDYFIVANGSRLGIVYGEGSNTGGFSNGTEIASFANSGFLGIGLDSPSYKLHQHVTDSGENYHLFTNSTTGTTTSDGFRIGIDSNEDALIWHRENEAIQFATNNTRRFRINNTGVVNVGEYGDQTVAGQIPIAQMAGNTSVQTTLCITRLENNANPPALHFAKTRSTSTGSFSILSAGDSLGKIEWHGDDGTDMAAAAAEISCIVGTGPSANDMPGELKFMTTKADATTPTEAMRIDSDQNVGIGTDNPASKLSVHGDGLVFRMDGTGNTTRGMLFRGVSTSNPGLIQADGSLRILTEDASTALIFNTNSSGTNNEAMRIDGSQHIYIGKDAGSNTVAGATITPAGQVAVVIDDAGGAQQCIFLNREDSDGTLITFRHSNSTEGSISVSGSTVSYNGFSGLHESSGIASNVAVGTVCSTIDELDVYSDTQPDEKGGREENPKKGQTRADHAKIKISDTVGDKRVYGVLQSYDENDKPLVASVGIGSIRVTGACEGGDLLESNGDGTAKVQSDDIIRSKTIGKVTIGNNNTGEKLVSCVLYCG